MLHVLNLMLVLLYMTARLMNIDTNELQLTSVMCVLHVCVHACVCGCGCVGVYVALPR